MTVSIGARVFATTVFVVLGLSFLVDTAFMAWEFGPDLRVPIAAFHPQLFLFFPTAGLVALAAFWRAACVVTDAYWRRVRLGKIIFVFAILLGMAGTYVIDDSFRSGASRVWWEVSPDLLRADTGEPAGCAPGECRRAPVIAAHQAVRAASRERGGLLEYAIDCRDDAVASFNVGEVQGPLYCFAAGEEMSPADCCAARQRLLDAVQELHRESPSMLSLVHRITLPLKLFFLFILLGLGVMLVRRRKLLERHYSSYMDEVERNAPLGALAMLVWPAMNQAFTQSWDTLFGVAEAGSYRVFAPLYMLAFGGWALVILFYYFRRYPDTLEMFAKVFGVALAAIGVVRYDDIIAYVNGFLGAGADVVSISVLGAAALFFIWQVFAKEEADEDAPAEEPSEETSP